MSEEIKFEKRSFKPIIATHFDQCIKSERKVRADLASRRLNNTPIIGTANNHIEQTRAAYRKANYG